MGFENDDAKSESRYVLSRSKITHGEHPLSLGKSSIWNKFFQVWNQLLHGTNALDIGYFLFYCAFIGLVIVTFLRD
jgi:hypothetical protein